MWQRGETSCVPAEDNFEEIDMKFQWEPIKEK